MLLIASIFSPELQGYYYTFGSLLALQSFAELGFGLVISQFSSHEWSKLRLDETGKIVGDSRALSRLASLTKFSLKWFTGGGIFILFGLGIGGYFFFAHSLHQDVHWMFPWFCLCILTGIIFTLNPIWAVLEGCNQVSNVYTFRFYQNLISRLLVWMAIIVGAGLWITTISSMVLLLCSIWFLHKKYFIFLKTIFNVLIVERINWWKEVWPMQWRFTLSGISGYFSFYFFIPILFKYHGAVVAGQMGMSWSIISLVGTISSSWVYPKVPRFGILIAQKKYKELDELFWRISRVVVAITGVSLISCWIFVYAINSMHLKFALPGLIL